MNMNMNMNMNIISVLFDEVKMMLLNEIQCRIVDKLIGFFLQLYNLKMQVHFDELIFECLFLNLPISGKL